jgi:hypothetical protein
MCFLHTSVRDLRDTPVSTCVASQLLYASDVALWDQARTATGRELWLWTIK